jgi:hypothetical protein
MQGRTLTPGGGLPQEWCAFTARRLVSAEFRIGESELVRPTRARQEVAFARQVAMYLVHVCYQLSYTEVGRVFGRERTTVAHACAKVEDAREDGGLLDERLDMLERRLRALADLECGGRRVLPPRPAAVYLLH